MSIFLTSMVSQRVMVDAESGGGAVCKVASELGKG